MSNHSMPAQAGDAGESTEVDAEALSSEGVYWIDYRLECQAVALDFIPSNQPCAILSPFAVIAESRAHGFSLLRHECHHGRRDRAFVGSELRNGRFKIMKFIHAR